jgi:hypothetical protein
MFHFLLAGNPGWFAQGLTEFEVMTLAGHSSFETTHKFYLSIKNDYLAKAKRANSDELGSDCL